MKAVMLMYDSLIRHMLPPYGCEWVHAPNFRRLAERAVTFDRSYVCSMPCMPARRDLHTGRPNFLHRSWGPLEPFDDSVPAMLKAAGVRSHLLTDHQHYFEPGGSTYHCQYSTWQFFRGQEGDPWMGQIADPPIPQDARPRGGGMWRQDWVNRQFIRQPQDFPQAQTMAAGIDFIDRNCESDNWFLQIETFDPHEPYYTPRQYKDLYADHFQRYQGRHFDWPPYAPVTHETPEEIEHVRHENAALVSMCDAKLGDLLDSFDRHNLWDDTMLIVWTDHGYLLSEHDCWAKCWMPFYQQIAHTPFFVWDPRSGKRHERRSALVQPAIDLGPTLLEYFGLTPTADMIGKPLRDAIADDTPVREAGIFGIAGGHVNVTDGRYVYMRAPAEADNEPLHDYTLMPTHMRGMFKTSDFENLTLAEPFSFTKGCRLMKIPRGGKSGGKSNAHKFGTLLFDVQNDPQQNHPLSDPAIEERMIERLIANMREVDAPAEQYERLGLGVEAATR